MFKYLVAALLLTVALQEAAAPALFLSPPFPPTGFYQQLYEVRFRVRGLNNPTFTFDNLPNFFTGSADGVVSGTPNITGTFKFTINYTEGAVSGSDKVVISVTANPTTAASAAQSAAVNLLVIQAALDSWIYRSGDSINIQLASENGVAPLTWSYKNLPAGLSGDNNGKVSGSIGNIGLYSFSASCGDSNGQKAESFYTLNVQPGTLIKTNNVIDVPDRNVPFLYNISQVEAQQIAADTAVTKALLAVKAAKAAVAAQQAGGARTQLALNLATTQEKAAENSFTKAQEVYTEAEKTLHQQETVLNTAKNALDLAQNALKNANAALALAESNFVKAETAFKKASATFNAANDAYTKAINELSQATATYNRAVAAGKDAQNAYNLAWNNVQTAKAELDEAKGKLLEADAKVNNAKNQLGLATQANDDSQIALKVADAALTGAQHLLEDANRVVGELRGELNAAKTAAGLAKYNLNQAMNNLYVAQAAKESADKATAIAYADGSSLNVLDGSSTYIFNGCLTEVYPAISGTVSVVSLISSGCQVSSGHILKWGECTTKDEVKVGDVIYYEGSIVGNSISAKIVKKYK